MVSGHGGWGVTCPARRAFEDDQKRWIREVCTHAQAHVPSHAHPHALLQAGAKGQEEAATRAPRACFEFAQKAVQHALTSTSGAGITSATAHTHRHHTHVRTHTIQSRRSHFASSASRWGLSPFSVNGDGMRKSNAGDAEAMEGRADDDICTTRRNGGRNVFGVSGHQRHRDYN